jgi:uncharacterized protein
MTPLIEGLLKACALAHPAPAPELIETHISWVILSGAYAYKIKKPLKLGFLDFSSLDKRRHFCTEEIRLNRRLAPEIYLGVVPISGSEAEPRFNGPGPVLEWAVQMRAFPANATLDREAEISREQIDAIAESIATFHAGIDLAPDGSAYGEPESVIAPVADNFRVLGTLCPAGDRRRQLLLARLQAWCTGAGDALFSHFAERKASGFIRECHGDLHLGNIAWVNRRPLIFDALEFNPGLRHIDLISEIAFLSMDLRHRGRHDLAWRLLDRYLELTGDIPGMAALSYYQVYRATVRAKVAAILASEHPEDGDTHLQQSLSYLELADLLADDRHPALLLMHGVSGSGKTWLSQQLLEQLGALRLRSDVTRKRLFGLKPLQESTAIAGGIYTPDADRRTLTTLAEEAKVLLAAGFLVIVDATFLHRRWRDPFQALARKIGVPWLIVALEAPLEVLQARISRRQQSGGDASEAGLAVLAAQLKEQDPLTTKEQAHTLHFTDDEAVADLVNHLRVELK